MGLMPEKKATEMPEITGKTEGIYIILANFLFYMISR